MNWISLLSDVRLHQEMKYKKMPPSHIRSAFEVDVDRIIFSTPFRMLQNKTQVVPLPTYDFVHTRLTHSLEVSSVGRSLGKKVGEHIIENDHSLTEQGISVQDFGAIVAAACLTHDIGNPPFGHAGERALSDFFLTNRPEGITDAEHEDLIKFEGNAQGFRILCNPQYADLKLTYATLATYTKYPCESLFERDAKRKSQKKFGFFQSEKTDFSSIATACGLTRLQQQHAVWARHPLSYLVEAADDICYLIIDLEDANLMGVIDSRHFKELVAPILGNRLDESKLNKMHDERQRAGILRALAINALIEETAENFIHHLPEIMEGGFDKHLTDTIPSSRHTQDIARYSVEHIYNSQHVLEIQAAGFEVLPGLLSMFWEAMDDCVRNGKRCNGRNLNLIRMLALHGIEPEANTYQRARQLIDYLSGMTDRYAVSLYKKIKGISI